MEVLEEAAQHKFFLENVNFTVQYIKKPTLNRMNQMVSKFYRRRWTLAGKAFACLILATALRLQAAEASAQQEMALVEKIRAKILQTSGSETEKELKDYKQGIAGSGVEFQMKAIPGGAFLMGSPPAEAGRKSDEGPQFKTMVGPFWIGVHEVTWDEFEIFMFSRDASSAVDGLSDAVSHPTSPYVDMSFGMGKRGYPAISMTHHAANKYCQWLSAKTGRFYRLPTEVEWEYSARAGTHTAFFFGDDPKDLEQYACFGADKYSPVGSRKPNAWGLYDMHGNVMEWTLDQYRPDAYSILRNKTMWIESTQPYPHVVRGGSWADEPDRLRSAARRGSAPEWKMLDPQLPKSVWYHTNAPWVGFRIVRPKEIPSAEEMNKCWNSGVELDGVN